VWLFKMLACKGDEEVLPTEESDRIEKDVGTDGTVKVFADLGWLGELSLELLCGHVWEEILISIFVLLRF
jgi:hypothetical protein